MKKNLLLGLLLAGGAMFSQTQPVVINAGLLEQAKASGSNCACAAWINKDLGSQGENSSDSRAADEDAIKFDNLEADLMYQEVAVEPNSSYTFTFNYRYSEGSSDTPRDPFVSPVFHAVVLKGSGYNTDYTVLYQDASDVSTFRTGSYGYTDIADVENTDNQLAAGIYNDPGDSEYVTETLTFNTGDETSIALLLRATGYVESYTDGDFVYDWISGDSEVRTGSVSLVNNGGTASTSDVLASKFAVFPNPTNSLVRISGADVELTSLQLFNTLGKQVFASKAVNSIDVSSFSKGIYFLKLNAEGASTTKKLIIE